MYKTLIFKNILLIIICGLFLPQVLFAWDITSTSNVTVSARVGSDNQGTSSGGFINIPTKINFSGKSLPYSTVFILNNNQVVATTITDSQSFFSISIDNLSENNYNFSLYSVYNNKKSLIFYLPIYIKNGTIVDVSGIYLYQEEPIPVSDACSTMRADLNCDSRVDWVDLSILVFWFNKINIPARVDLNNDKMISLVDFSIMAFYWTR